MHATNGNIIDAGDVLIIGAGLASPAPMMSTSPASIILPFVACIICLFAQFNHALDSGARLIGNLRVDDNFRAVEHHRFQHFR